MLRALLRLALHRGHREGAPARRSSTRRGGRRRRASSHAARASARRARARSSLTESAVPDVLAPGLRVVFCGINPGRASAAARAPFANPRNDFWRLLHAAGFTPRLLEPQEFRELPRYGIGLTNAARRTTRGSSDLRAADFAGARERIEAIATDLRPHVIAFVGKAAYQGVFRERPDHGLQEQGAGRDPTLRAPVHLARERRSPVGRAAPLVPRAVGAQPVQRFVIGVRRSRPNAFGRSFTPGGAWRRLYSARSTRATARSTTSGSNSARSSSRERSSST